MQYLRFTPSSPEIALVALIVISPRFSSLSFLYEKELRQINSLVLHRQLGPEGKRISASPLQDSSPARLGLQASRFNLSKLSLALGLSLTPAPVPGTWKDQVQFNYEVGPDFWSVNPPHLKMASVKSILKSTWHFHIRLYSRGNVRMLTRDSQEKI